MCAGEIFFCTPLVSVPPFFENLILTAATSKMKVRNCTTEESFSVPPQESIFAPPPPKVVQFLTLKVVHFLTFISLYGFPYLGQIGASSEKNRTSIENQVGTSLVQFLTFSKLGVIFYNMTSFIHHFLVSSWLFSFFMLSSFMLC